MSRGGLAHKKYWLLVDAREARVTGSVPPAHRNLFLKILPFSAIVNHSIK